MKRLILPVMAIMGAASAEAQTKKVTKAVVKTPVTAPVLKNGSDSLSYALGINIGSSLKQQGMQNLNMDMIKAGMEDMLKDRKAKMDQMTAMQTIQEKLKAAMESKVSAQKARGAAYAKEFASRPGAVSLPNGLMYQVIKSGPDGGAKPSAQDTVVVHYVGTTIDGEEFDSSVKRGQPAEFGLARVISGWTQILQLMSKGSKWRVLIPSELGYGDRGAGAMIAPGATLLFDIELLDIKPVAVK